MKEMRTMPEKTKNQPKIDEDLIKRALASRRTEQEVCGFCGTPGVRYETYLVEPNTLDFGDRTFPISKENRQIMEKDLEKCKRDELFWYYTVCPACGALKGIFSWKP